MSPVRIPSPAALGLAAFGIGIAAGVQPRGAVIAAVLGIAAAIGVWAWREERPGLVMATLVAVVGVGHGALARAGDHRRCSAQLAPGVVSLVVRLDEPAPRNRPVRATPLGLGCRGEITVRHRSGDTLLAGSLVAVQGSWQPRPSPWRAADGILTVTRLERRGNAAGPLDRLRNHLLRSIGALFGSRAGIVEALLVGSRGTIDRDLGDAFSRTGLVHLLSISGFHVGLVWAWVLLILRLTGVRRGAPAIAAVLVVGYVGFIGASPPAVRAALLAVVSAIERGRQRSPATGALFAAVALAVLLVDPFAVGDLGGWLSITALWGATAAVTWSDRALGTAPFWRMTSSSIGATIATAPITALGFGTVPVAGILLNLVAIPITALAVPAVAASLIAATVSGVAGKAFAAGGGALLALLEVVAVRGAQIPGAAISFEAGVGPALLAVGTVGVVVWAFGARQTGPEAARRLLWCAGTLAIGHAAVLTWPRPPGGSRLTLHFLDVGQGDATLLETPHGHWILIDAGPADDRWDAGRRVILPFLRTHGVRRLDAVILSHGHRDHFGGIPAVAEIVRIDRLVEPGRRIADRAYLAMLDAIDDAGAQWLPARRGASLAIDGVTLSAVHPDTSWADWGDDLNEDSVVLRISAGNFSALFAGDAGFPVEERIAESVGRVDLLKVGHHGSRWATGDRWLVALTPKLAVVSVAAKNGYGHPSPEAMGRLATARVPVWRTDQDGTITVSVGDDWAEVRGRGRSARISIR